MTKIFGWTAESGYGVQVHVNEQGINPPLELHFEGTNGAGDESGDVVIDLPSLDDLCDLHGMIALAIEAYEASSRVAS